MVLAAAAVVGLLAALVLVAVVVPGARHLLPGEAAPTTSEEASPTPEDTTDLTNPAKRDRALQLVSSAENSTLDWRAQYGYIEWDVEGVPEENRGYTAGLIGFCSGCGDMTRLVEYYASTAPGNRLERYLPALREQEELGMGNVTQAGLGRAFVDDWRAAADDPLFQAAQDHVLDLVYFDPAVEQGRADGVHALGQFIYFDALVMHGPGTDARSFGGIRDAALQVASPPSQGGDEVEWLDAFLDARVAAMQAERAHRDTSRVDTGQRQFLEQGNLHLNPPLRWATYGDAYRIP
ncbi:chitosanase [Geodermatophilus sabuli]|uniref:chitosanase n=1 Tax=Geodermatophilus sabuli TaxID=1564158 RepID=UPI0031F2FFF5